MGFISLTHLQTALNKIKTIFDTKANKTEIPTTLPANGGNADTVNGHTVNANVPADAVFTDTTYSAGTGLSLSGTTFNHKNSITAGTAQGDATKTLTFGGTFTIPTVTYDAQGHITGKGTTTMTMPANPNTDTKVTNTLAKTTKAYVTGTTSSSTNTGTQVFDTGVYLDTTAGQIVATTFKGALSGNASTATALTSSAGTTHIPVRFSNGKPVAVSEILKYNTGGSLLHGDTTISYASGYKYALIFAYYNHNLGKTPEYTHPLAIALVGNMSSTTSYNKKPLTESGPNSLSFTVTNGDIIFNNNGGDNYGYLIIWSN